MLIYLALAVLCLLPGGLAGLVVPPGRERWIAWSAAPILTLGLTAAAMAWLPAAGLPSGALWVLAAEIILALAAAAASWLAARRHPGSAAAPAVAAAVPAAEKVPAAAVHTAAGTPDPAPSGPRLPLTADEPPGPPGRGVTLREWLLGGTRRPPLADLAGAAIPAAAAVAFGRLFLGGLAWPPGWDAMNHALLTRNIIETGSTVSATVCTTGHPLPQVACHFYPLGADVSWAQAAIVTGSHISAVMLAWSVLIGPLALVLAVYTAVRAFGGTPLMAGSAAIAPVLLSPLWPSLLSGRPPESFAPGMGIAVALLAALAIRGKHPIRLGLLAGLGLAGLAITHTSDVVFAGVLALAFLTAGPLRLRLRPAAAAAGAAVLATVAACAPLTSALLSARSERSGSISRDLIPWRTAWHYWITSPRRYVLLGTSPYGGSSRLHVLPVQVALWLTLACLVASVLCFALRELRWARPWLLTWVAWAALGLWTSVSGSPAAQFLTSLWYGQPGRLRMMALPLNGVLVVAGACAIGLGGYRLALAARRRGRNLRLEQVAAGLAACVAAVTVTGLAALPPVHRPITRQYRQREPLGTAYPRVFRWLAAHISAGKVVAYNQNVDYLTWSYADYGVPGLFGIGPRPKPVSPDDVDRPRAFAWLVGNPGVPPSGCLVRRYRIEYVAAGRRHLPAPGSFPPTMTVTQAWLAASPNITLVHHDHGLQVYRVTAAGRACPG